MVAGILIACGGFLLAVLWMDLMFDVQVLRYRGASGALPDEVLASIAAYYRRVTTDAKPMGHLIGAVMAVAVVAGVIQTASGRTPLRLALASLLLSGAPILLAMVRVFPNAVRLATRVDPPSQQTALARSICRDHLLCFAGILAFLALQLSTASR